METLLQIDDLAKSFGGLKALEDVSISVGKSEIVGLIGPNGAGKSTLFNVLNGLLKADSGHARFKGHELVGHAPHRIANLGIARTFQDVRLIRRISVIDNVLLCFRHQPSERLHNIFFRPRLCRDHEKSILAQAEAFITTAGLSENANDAAEILSYGQQKLLSIVGCLAAEAELLLLDEPIAGLAPEMKAKILGMIKALPAQRRSVIMIEHDMDAIREVCSRVVFMDAGRVICEGTPDEVRNNPQVIEAYLGVSTQLKESLS